MEGIEVQCTPKASPRNKSRMTPSAQRLAGKCAYRETEAIMPNRKRHSQRRHSKGTVKEREFIEQEPWPSPLLLHGNRDAKNRRAGDTEASWRRRG